MTEINKKLMLAGLFLSKFDKVGLEKLGFKTWNEAYNTLAFSIGGRPLSVKGYRDEFDPMFPDNPRKGWHKREAHQDRIDLFNRLGGLGLDEFAELLRSQFAEDGEIDAVMARVAAKAAREGEVDPEETSFAKRMLTGQACENFFEQHYREYEDFALCDLKRTTHLGCGFDFKLSRPDADFLAVEVKGLRTSSGQIQLTDKEFRTADALSSRFYLYVLTNFVESPRPLVIPNPLASGIEFEKHKIESTQTVWIGSVAVAG